MSAADRIQMQLSPFEKMAILRVESEQRAEELKAMEVEIRDKLFQIETQRYLEALSPYYAAHPPQKLPTQEEIETLEQRRNQLQEVLKIIEAALPGLLQAGGMPPPPAAATSPPASGQARKVKFDSFDDFRKKQD